VVSALATAVGLNEGISSALFGIAVVLALAVIYGAIVRRKWGEVTEVTKQAGDKDTKSNKHSANQVVLNGHTPLEVLLGVALGIAVAYLWIEVISG
jgi:acid phosphatase family membrane protein YuiD